MERVHRRDHLTQASHTQHRDHLAMVRILAPSVVDRDRHKDPEDLAVAVEVEEVMDHQDIPMC